MAEGQSTGTLYGKPTRVIEDKLLDRVKKTVSGCWEWTAYRGERGYGKFTPKTGETVAAHRLSYLLFCGPIPDGMLVCHRCDNPPCCNPAHLFLGTHVDNMRDRDEKGRTPRGSQLPQQKLTDEQREAIRNEYRRLDPEHNITALARKYGVGVGTIHRVLNRQTH